MAHDLNFNQKTGQYSFFSVKEKPWHNLGLIVDQYPTSAEAIQYAGLDYEVAKLPSGKEELSDSSFFTYRTDTEVVLGSRVGPIYEILQNRDAFSFFDEIVGGGDGILYETAGALGRGERVFITAKLPDYIRVGKDDVTEKYIFLTSSHDGSASITEAFTPVRIVCQNTLNAALRNKTNVVRFRHTTNVKERFANAHKVMGIANHYTKELEGIFNQWAKVKVTDREVHKLIQLALCPGKETLELLSKGAYEDTSTKFKNTVEDVFTYAMLSESQQMDTTKGTLFGTYNAVTGYYQNVCDYKSDEKKFDSIVVTGGTAQKKIQQAFELCTGFEKSGADLFKFSLN